MNLEEFYHHVGGNFEEAKCRFQNDERILRFLRMLPRDNSMNELTDAMQRSDAPTAFRAAHTLKGVAMNLALDALAGASSELTEALRGKETMPEGCDTLYQTLSKTYSTVCEALAQVEL